ncbi:MAG TPA: hypothetical protein VHV32_00890 [Candidatus Angelobacter sp.]|jgi:hypothetical protein|nr:hypothetical protein [Candidatus Angelobacter sp.]
MDDISIDRLVLNVPGLSAEEAQNLATRVGLGLAAAPAAPGSYGTLSVELNDEALTRDLPRLANGIVVLLLEQMG